VINKPNSILYTHEYNTRVSKRLGRLPFTAISLGSWWGNETVEKAQADVDVIAVNSKDKKIKK